MGWRDFIGETLRASTEEQVRHQSREAAQLVDTEVVAVLVSTAVLLTLQFYFFIAHGPPRWVFDGIEPWLGSVENHEIIRLGYRTFGDALIYFVVPVIVLSCFSKRPLSDYGLKLNGALGPWRLYLAMFSAMFPCIVLASYSPSFLQTYPFYHLLPGESYWPRLIIWESLYALQFVGLEFFFRGFLLHGTRLRLGPYSILVMMVPYCMIHFGKPLPETLGAIGAGLVLGFLSLRYRSIWLGAALHIGVAWTMDAMALWSASSSS